MKRARTSDVIVVGGGLFGAFSGLFLARAGVKVTLLEKGLIGAQASATNFGNLRLHGRSAHQYPLSIRAQELWEDYRSLTGEDCEIIRTGHLYFARGDRGQTQLRSDVKTAKRFGVDSELLESDQLHKRFDFLSKKIRLAAFSPRSAVANPRLSAPPVARALLRAGGQVEESCEVATLDRSATGFLLTTKDGRCFEAPKVVNAAGAWAGGLAAQVGEPVPMFSAGPPQFVTEPLPHRLHPSVHMVEGDVIVRQIPRGNIIFSGYPRTRSLATGEFTYVPPAKTLRGMKELVDCIPMLARAEIIRVWSGVEGYLPDMLPVIGASIKAPGLFHAFGGSGGGFQIAPAVGEAIAALFLERPPAADVSRYGIDRFSQGAEVSEKIYMEFDQ